MTRILNNAVSGLLLGAAIILPCQAQTPSKATVEKILDSNQVYIEQRQAAVNDKADSPERIRTGQARTQLKLNNGAVARINQNSVFRLGDSCFHLASGQALISGRASGCTRSTRVSVRGTNYIITVNTDKSTTVSVLDGKVEITPLLNNQATRKYPTLLSSGQTVTISPAGGVGNILQLSPIDYQDVLGGALFIGWGESIPGISQLEGFLGSWISGALDGSVSYTSNISEVDSCNQAQYLIPTNSTPTKFTLRTNKNGDNYEFRCRVNWSFSHNARQNDLPILFPSRPPAPFIWGLL